MNKPLDKRIIVPLDLDLLAAIDAYKASHRKPSRAAAIRDLIFGGLDAAARARSARRLETALGLFKPKDDAR